MSFDITENKHQMAGLITVLLTMGFFGALAGLFFVPIPESNEPVIFSMVGALATSWVGSINYFVGTTKSSQEKNDIIRRNS
jgi:hypothetical protein